MVALAGKIARGLVYTAMGYISVFMVWTGINQIPRFIPAFGSSSILNAINDLADGFIWIMEKALSF